MRIMVQGITGRTARLHAGLMAAYGEKNAGTVVCGVTPFKGGQSVDGVPVYDSVRQALARHAVDISVVFVPAAHAPDAILEAAEVYYCLSGEGAMLMETPEGESTMCMLKPGDSLYVPGRNAHRSVNTGSTPLVMFFAFRSDAGHNYGAIEEKGYRKLLLDVDGVPTLFDNPKWSEN